MVSVGLKGPVCNISRDLLAGMECVFAPNYHIMFVSAERACLVEFIVSQKLNHPKVVFTEKLRPLLPHVVITRWEMFLGVGAVDYRLFLFMVFTGQCENEKSHQRHHWS